MHPIVHRSIRNIVKLRKCLLCNESPSLWTDLFCVSCQDDFESRLNPRHCHDREGVLALEKISFASFDGAVAAYLRRLKSARWGLIDVAEWRVLEQLIQYWSYELAALSFDTIVAVPSHPLRVFSQTDLSQLFAVSLSKYTRRPLVKGVIQTPLSWALRSNSTLKALNRADRLYAVQERFRIHEPACSRVARRRVLLVDDVSTTGASLRRCTDLLESAGAHVMGHCVIGQTPHPEASRF